MDWVISVVDCGIKILNWMENTRINLILIEQNHSLMLTGLQVESLIAKKNPTLECGKL